MSYLTNPYMVAPTGGGAIYGTHWYQFGGKGGVDGTDEQITEYFEKAEKLNLSWTQ